MTLFPGERQAVGILGIFGRRGVFHVPHRDVGIVTTSHCAALRQAGTLR
jgi:hypothetical protein